MTFGHLIDRPQDGRQCGFHREVETVQRVVCVLLPDGGRFGAGVLEEVGTVPGQSLSIWWCYFRGLLRLSLGLCFFGDCLLGFEGCLWWWTAFLFLDFHQMMTI